MAVPVFVQAAHGFRGYIAQAEFTQDVRAAVAAQGDDFLVIAVLRESDAHDGGYALNGARAPPTKANRRRAPKRPRSDR